MRVVVRVLTYLACAVHARKLRYRKLVREQVHTERVISQNEALPTTNLGSLPRFNQFTAHGQFFNARHGDFSRRGRASRPLEACARLLLEVHSAAAFTSPGSLRRFVGGPPLLRRVAGAPCMTKPTERRWEDVRSGEMNMSAIEAGLDLDGCAVPARKFPRLHQVEYDVMKQIQRVPGLLQFSLAVHYSLLPKVITPLLALIVWLSSLPLGASLITFVCANDCLNTALKWAVQRPRPRWYCPIQANDLISSCGAWEVDLSFPSAHTMFFAGLAACASTLYGFPLWGATLFGLSIGISRNYLSMHWPTDTLLGVVFGVILGLVWGTVDPYARLLAIGSPMLSFSFASWFTAGLLALMVATRQAVPPVTSTERTFWFANALCSLSPEEREVALASRKKQLRPRSLKSKIPMLVTVWATLALTGLYPFLLQQASSEPFGSLGRRFAQAAVGVIGLGGVASLKTTVGRLPLGKNVEGKKAALKALTYLALCTWTFLLSQIVGGLLLSRLGIL